MLPTPRILPTPQEITPRMKRKLEQGWIIDLNDRIAITPIVESSTIGVINHAVPIALQSKASIIDNVLENMVTSNNWGSKLVCLQWITRPLYSILRKNGSGKDGKKQFSLLYQLSPSPLNNSQSELLPTPNTMEGLEPKSKESILAYNAKCRPGKSYATSNLRERLAHGKMEAEMAMLPTPITDNGHERSPKYWKNREEKHQVDLQGKIATIPKIPTLKLQPEFTLWMMGFPTDWLNL
jgi:hypothetical protein